MPTSKTERAVSAATDSPLGVPGGNDPYKTVRSKNWANPDKEVNDTGNSMYTTTPAGNPAQGSGETPAPKGDHA